MRIQVLFFGMLKDIAGRSGDSVELAEGAVAGDLFDQYAARFPGLGELAGSIVLARNEEFVARDAALREGDEVAFLPPVSGGASPYIAQSADGDGNFFALTRKPIDTRRLLDRVLRGEDGAVVTFEGVVRNNSKGRATRFLDYECYEAMALKVMARIGGEIAARPDVGRVAMVHRLGRLLIGEASVVVVVTSPHRRAAFDAALDGINRLKRLVPIWKKEYFEDGEVWVEGEWDADAPVAGGG
ncbi:MAG: molybdenum cofactor biosynthesis protein MoaE [Bryobacterales bacterium]|nr:molybdenum cofactor biosynthesis protein MoaE [Bryobacterales bacterium]